jgi:hypothetical protein
MPELRTDDLPHVPRICAALGALVRSEPAAHTNVMTIYVHVQRHLERQNLQTVPFGTFMRTLRTLGFKTANKHVYGMALIQRQRT